MAHDAQNTNIPLVACIDCLTIGVCLWCGVIPPQGAYIIACPAHAEFATMHAAIASIICTQVKEENRGI